MPFNLIILTMLVFSSSSSTFAGINYPEAKIEVIPVVECKLSFAKFKNSIIPFVSLGANDLEECQEKVEEKCTNFQDRLDAGENSQVVWNQEFGNCFGKNIQENFSEIKPDLNCFCSINSELKLSQNKE